MRLKRCLEFLAEAGARWNPFHVRCIEVHSRHVARRRKRLCQLREVQYVKPWNNEVAAHTGPKASVIAALDQFWQIFNTMVNVKHYRYDDLIWFDHTIIYDGMISY